MTHRPQKRPWAQIFGTLIGIAMMFSPAAFNYVDTTLSEIHRTIGPVIASLSVTAFWDATRPLRWANLPLGLATIVAGVVWPAGDASVVVSVMAGVIVMASTPFGGVNSQKLGKGWRGVVAP